MSCAQQPRLEASSDSVQERARSARMYSIPLHFVQSLSVSCDAYLAMHCVGNTQVMRRRVCRASFLRSPACNALRSLRAMLCVFFVLLPHNLLLHCSSVLRVSREGAKCSLHGKTRRWRIVLCAVTNLLLAAHILAGTQCLCPNPRRIRTRV